MSRRLSPCLSLFAALSLATGALAADGQPVELLGLSAEVPAAWVRESPESGMRALQFRVPAAGEAEKGAAAAMGAEVVVYYFGPGQGGSLDANLARWTSQFSNPDGSPVEPEVTELAGKLPATLVALRGSYARGVGMGPADEALADRMLLAAIVETPKGNLYPQLHGPAELVASQRDAFVAFIEGIAPNPGAAPGAQ